MGNGIEGISKESFEKMDVNSKLNVVFDCLVVLCKRKRHDTTIAAISGFVGGAAAIIGKLVFWGK